MGDQLSESIYEARRDWVVEHRRNYLRSGGSEGHIMDITAVGGRFFATHCLLRFRGRKSKRVFITPLTYADIGGEVVVCASNAGADRHPEWYLNVVAEKDVEFQIATQAFRGSWREPEGAERDKVWRFFIDCHPFYAEYQTSTDRRLPLLMLSAQEAIAVFKEPDRDGAQP